MHIKPPQVIVPEFWLANYGAVQNYLHHRLRKGRCHDIGRSSLGYPLHMVEYPRAGGVRLMVMAGCHGHEPATVAAAMNLAHLMETGRDLAGQPHEKLMALLERVHLFIMPCLNPDTRNVCPDSFYMQAAETTNVYACGVKKDGTLIPYDAGSQEPLYEFPPEEAMFIGGQFNGAGLAMNRRRSLDRSDAVELQAVLEFVADKQIEANVDLHGCAYNILIQARSHEAAYWDVLREWHRRGMRAYGEKGRELRPTLEGDANPPAPPKFFGNSALLHKHTGMLSFTLEGRQGYLGQKEWLPLPTEWEIIDDYLTGVTVSAELGVEGYYRRAHEATYGKWPKPA